MQSARRYYQLKQKPGQVFAYLISAVYAILAPVAYIIESPIYPYPALTYYFVEGAILTLLLARLAFHPLIILLVLASTFLQVHFLFYSLINDLSPDIAGHMDYIRYLTEHNFVPPIPSGWQRQQPPLYYEWCALAYRIGQWLGLDDPWWAVRVSSRTLYHGYMICMLLLIRRFNFAFPIACALVACNLFWPCAYMISTRVNSDIGFISLFMPCLLCSLQWYDTQSRRSLSFALLWASLSLCCKATGIVSFLTITGIAVVLHCRKNITLQYYFHRSLRCAAVTVLAAFAIYFGRIGYYRYFEAAQLNWFANTYKVWPNLINLQHLTWFHFADFVTHPIFIPKELPYLCTFWDFMIRTLLYSNDGAMTGPPLLFATINLSLLCIGGLAFWTIGRAIRHPSKNHAYLPLLIALACLIFTTMAQHVLVPDYWLAHGRRIIPVIAITSLLAGIELSRLKESGHILSYYLCLIIFFVFAGASAWLTFDNAYSFKQFSALQYSGVG